MLLLYLMKLCQVSSIKGLISEDPVNWEQFLRDKLGSLRNFVQHSSTHCSCMRPKQIFNKNNKQRCVQGQRGGEHMPPLNMPLIKFETKCFCHWCKKLLWRADAKTSYNKIFCPHLMFCYAPGADFSMGMAANSPSDENISAHQNP